MQIILRLHWVFLSQSPNLDRSCILSWWVLQWSACSEAFPKAAAQVWAHWHLVMCVALGELVTKWCGLFLGLFDGAAGLKY